MYVLCSAAQRRLCITAHHKSSTYTIHSQVKSRTWSKNVNVLAFNSLVDLRAGQILHSEDADADVHHRPNLSRFAAQSSPLRGTLSSLYLLASSMAAEYASGNVVICPEVPLVPASSLDAIRIAGTPHLVSDRTGVTPPARSNI